MQIYEADHFHLLYNVNPHCKTCRYTPIRQYTFSLMLYCRTLLGQRAIVCEGDNRQSASGVTPEEMTHSFAPTSRFV